MYLIEGNHAVNLFRTRCPCAAGTLDRYLLSQKFAIIISQIAYWAPEVKVPDAGMLHLLRHSVSEFWTHSMHGRRRSPNHDVISGSAACVEQSGRIARAWVSELVPKAGRFYVGILLYL